MGNEVQGTRNDVDVSNSSSLIHRIHSCAFGLVTHLLASLFACRELSLSSCVPGVSLF